jgi:hypothetical protein
VSGPRDHLSDASFDCIYSWKNHSRQEHPFLKNNSENSVQQHVLALRTDFKVETLRLTTGADAAKSCIGISIS